MTPEQAKELLERATPGPWRAEKVADCKCCTRVGSSSALVCVPDMADAPLIAAAPELAEQIASMRYEYLVQEDVGYLRDHGAPFDTIEEARQYRDMKREDAPMVIVRRMVTNWEVVEHD